MNRLSRISAIRLKSTCLLSISLCDPLWYSRCRDVARRVCTASARSCGEQRARWPTIRPAEQPVLLSTARAAARRLADCASGRAAVARRSLPSPAIRQAAARLRLGLHPDLPDRARHHRSADRGPAAGAVQHHAVAGAAGARLRLSVHRRAWSSRTRCPIRACSRSSGCCRRPGRRPRPGSTCSGTCGFPLVVMAYAWLKDRATAQAQRVSRRFSRSRDVVRHRRRAGGRRAVGAARDGGARLFAAAWWRTTSIPTEMSLHQRGGLGCSVLWRSVVLGGGGRTRCSTSG